MYNIIPLVLILISLLIIIVIIARKFPALANLDVENIPLEKEAKFKERILSNRIKRNLYRWGEKFLRVTRPIAENVKNFFKWLYSKLIELRESYRKEIIETADIGLRVQELFKEFEELKEKGDLPAAEKKLIAIIGLDSKNIRAFKILGCLYFEQKNYEEAKQTFEYILKLKDNIEDGYEKFGAPRKEGGSEETLLSFDSADVSQTYFDLALTHKALNNLNEAMINVKNSLKIEPNNPRYLDTMLEISIIIKDKVSALEAYEKLKEVNPENQKLEELKRQIDEL